IGMLKPRCFFNDLPHMELIIQQLGANRTNEEKALYARAFSHTGKMQREFKIIALEVFGDHRAARLRIMHTAGGMNNNILSLENRRTLPRCFTVVRYFDDVDVRNSLQPRRGLAHKRGDAVSLPREMLSKIAADIAAR